MTNQAADGLEEATERLRRMQARHEAERKAARFKPNGKFRRVESWNADIVKEALARERIPGGKVADFWITYSGMRESWLRLREDRGWCQRRWWRPRRAQRLRGLSQAPRAEAAARYRQYCAVHPRAWRHHLGAQSD